VPAWAPAYLAHRGRRKYETVNDREFLWENLRQQQHNSDPLERVSQCEARAYQETHLRQVRALLNDVETFRCSRLTKAQRCDWSITLRTWVMWRLAERPNVHTSATVIGWIHMVRGRLPSPPSALAMASLLRGLAATKLLRPANRTRAVAPEIETALRAQLALATSDANALLIWITMVMMAVGALRLADAVRLLMPGAVDDWVEIGCEVILFPVIEKTDMTGAREIEPVVLCLPNAIQRALVCAHLTSSTSMTNSGALRIERETADTWHSHGVNDVRAIRRTIGERASSRKDAGILLRHAPNSSVTLRYSGTRDRIPSLRSIGRKVAFATDHSVHPS
jgi:hypothetical protein